MKHTGTIEIDCADGTCDDCSMYSPLAAHCYLFTKDLEINYFGYSERCPQCLATFKPVPVDIEAAMDKVIQEMSPELYKLMKEKK